MFIPLMLSKSNANENSHVFTINYIIHTASNVSPQTDYWKHKN